MPIKSQESKQTGQGLVEYALVLVLVAAIITAVLITIGPTVGNTFSKVASFPTPGAPTAGSTPTPPQCSTDGVSGILADMRQRILNYYNNHGSWPRTFDPYAYTDVGLNPTDWAGPVDCIYWGPHGSNIGLANRAGDNIQIFVKDLNGNTLHLFDGWNIWCLASSPTCYFHTIAPGNDVDISTLTAVIQ
jgi:pilus assembly protein Flp/PilA